MVNEIELVGYQRKAVDAIKADAIHFLGSGNSRAELTLKSPTGSGKTVMATAIMEELYEERKDVAFLWTSVGKGGLHEQSAKSVEEKTSMLNVKYVENSYLGAPMEPGDVFFINWEKLFRAEGGVLTSEGEGFNFFDLINLTKDNGTKIILVIDESHLGAGADTNTSRVRDKMKADLTLNFSATPTGDQRTGYAVDFDEVIEAGFIKKTLRINDGIDITDPDGETSILLKAAKEKREVLKKLYPNGINPLVVIALPNGNFKREEVETVLARLGVNYDNKKLAIWLSSAKDKVNLEGITAKDSEVEFLICKTAVATGWDCPRAHILVRLRKAKSEKFSRQLLGRILRMPERRHYNSEALNVGYVYTDDEEVKFENDAFPTQKIKDKKTVLKKGVNLTLKVKRLGNINKTQVYKDTYKPLLYKQLDKRELKYTIDNITTKLIQSTEDMDIQEGGVGEFAKTTVTAGSTAVGHTVEGIIKEILKEGGISTPHSIRLVVGLLAKYIIDKTGWDPLEGRKPGLVIYHNEGTLRDCILDSLNEYHEVIKDEIKRREYKTIDWTPPVTLWFDKSERNQKWSKYAYGRCYSTFNNLEFEYADSIDDDVNVAWWFKNGDSGKEHFSIPYGDGKNFFPDFIVGYHDGSKKITETKGTIFHDQRKQDALVAYGKEHGLLTEYHIDKVEEVKHIPAEPVKTPEAEESDKDKHRRLKEELSLLENQYLYKMERFFDKEFHTVKDVYLYCQQSYTKRKFGDHVLHRSEAVYVARNKKEHPDQYGPAVIKMEYGLAVLKAWLEELKGLQ